jgi:uncharacterized protein YndB with AHSA1/START domain
MISIPKNAADMTMEIVQEIHVRAPIDVTFDALLEEIGPKNQTHDGRAMPLKIEAWPGGRWYRDLGDNNGHFWGNVQAIKRPSLLEFCGPLMLSYPCVSNVQYRLTEKDGGTLITFRHTAMGFIQDQQKEQMNMGWGAMNERVRKVAEAGGAKKAAG